MFVSLTSHDYSLLPGSECIDTGNPDSVYNDPDGTRSDLGAIVFDGPPFNCGDPNDDGAVNIIDITMLIQYLYLGGEAPEFLGSGDVNSSGDVNILDVTYLIAYLYNEGPEPYCVY